VTPAVNTARCYIASEEHGTGKDRGKRAHPKAALRTFRSPVCIPELHGSNHRGRSNSRGHMPYQGREARWTEIRPAQSQEDRHAFENLLLLCANHHRVIDGNLGKYTVDSLRKMKAVHETTTGILPQDVVDRAVRLLQEAAVASINQSGGVTAQTVNQTFHVHARDAAPAPGAEAARGIFSPELARILAQQIHILDRAIANFICASVGNPQPTDHWSTFKPWRPSLYPAAAEFRDLAGEDAALLVEFYDSLNEIDDLIKDGAKVKRSGM
jgi:hypothetical protein